MTSLRLDTADGHHRLTPYVDRVASERKGDHRVGRKSQFPRPYEDHILLDPGLGENPIHTAESDLEGQRHVIRKRERCGSGPSTLTELSDEQADYIGVDKAGPYKPETYRY